jgi:hypothetical protein
MQVLFAAVLIDANHTTLEDAVIALNGVSVDLLAAFTVTVAVFAARVINGIVLGKVIAKLGYSEALRRS